MGAHQDGGAEPRQGARHARRGVPRSRHDGRRRGRAQRGGAARAAEHRYKKAHAVALERTAAASGGSSSRRRVSPRRGRSGRSCSRPGKNDKIFAREARTHIVTLYGLLHQLDQQVAPLQRKFAQRPPDVEAGRLLAEVQTRLHRLPDAEVTLRRVTELAPGDADAFLALERVLVLRAEPARRDRGAREAGRGRPEARPRVLPAHGAVRGRALPRRRRDRVRGARRASSRPKTRGPSASSARCTARSRTSSDAIVEFRAAIAKNDRLFPVYFELAELLLSRGSPTRPTASSGASCAPRPTKSWSRTRRGSRCRSTSARATLETLEQELLPVAIGNPRKTIYRRLLVELYGAMTFPLMQTVRHGQPAEVQTREKSARYDRRARGEAAPRRARRRERGAAAHRDRSAGLRREQERGPRALRLRHGPGGATAARASDGRVRGAARRRAHRQVRIGLAAQGRRSGDARRSDLDDRGLERGAARGQESGAALAQAARTRLARAEGAGCDRDRATPRQKRARPSWCFSLDRSKRAT